MKKVLLGITGGIACYKSAELTRLLIKSGFDVRVVMTKSATEFITPLTLQVLSGYPVKTELLDVGSESEIDHITLARWADLILIAPASANTIAKLSLGLCDDFLSTLVLASQVPLWLAPAMNQAMWQNKVTQQNISVLRHRGAHILGPEEGEQACHEIGPGRLIEPQIIVDFLLTEFSKALHPRLRNKHILITAGPTREPLDPVRYLSNYSSGKMGFALAEAASAFGAKVTLISGPTTLVPPHGVKTHFINTAEEMLDAVTPLVKETDIFIGAAAVADYRIKNPLNKKMTKQNTPNDLTLTLEQCPDILKSVSCHPNRPYTVGFALQTENLIEQAQNKLKNKKLDMICANLVGENTGFNSDYNTITLITPNGQKQLSTTTKTMLARQILTHIAACYQSERCDKTQIV